MGRRTVRSRTPYRWGTAAPIRSRSNWRPIRDARELVYRARRSPSFAGVAVIPEPCSPNPRSEEHTSELQSLMSNSSAVYFLKKKKHTQHMILHNTSHNINSPLLESTTK